MIRSSISAIGYTIAPQCWRQKPSAFRRQASSILQYRIAVRPQVWMAEALQSEHRQWVHKNHTAEALAR